MPPNLKQLSYENEDREIISSFQKQGYRTNLLLYVNGKKISPYETQQAKPNQTLLSFLRQVLRLTGSKLGCAEGGCGACTVLLSKYSSETGMLQHMAVNACLMPVCAADGCHITTIEGIGSVKDENVHPIQERMVDLHGSQCGYCTPGIIVAMYGLFASGNKSVEEVEEHLDGNLCRCTGYRPIWDSIKSLCEDEVKEEDNGSSSSSGPTGPCGEACRSCPEREECTMPCNENDKNDEKVTCQSSSTHDKCSSLPKMSFEFHQHPEKLFPTDLVNYKDEPFILVSESSTWLKPTTVMDLLSLKDQFPDAKIVVGNTEVGIETKFKHAVYPRYLTASSVPELHQIQQTDLELKIGSCTSLSTIQHYCHGIVSKVEKEKTPPTSILSNCKIEYAMLHMLRWFASTQIRNVASLSGNLVTASPISDMNPLLACMGATLDIESITPKDDLVDSKQQGGRRHRRTVTVANFFKSYRTVDLKSNEVLTCISIPTIPKGQFTYVLPFKQARRREDDISIVTGGISMTLSLTSPPSSQTKTFFISKATLAFGGMAPTTVIASQTMDFLVQKEWCEESFANARRVLLEEFNLPENVPGGQAAYRRTLAASFLYKFYLAVSIQLEKDVESQYVKEMMELEGGTGISSVKVPILEPEKRSGAQSFVTSQKPSIHGTQTHPAPLLTVGAEDLKFKAKVDTFPPKPTTNSTGGDAGKSITHKSGKYHCTGEAIYVDDMPIPEGMLHSALVLSNRSCGTIKSVDTSQATKMKGVVGVFTYDDLKKTGGCNELGPIFHDEEVFATKEIRHYGMVIGIVVAESLEVAQEASRAVVVTYDENDVKKPIITIEEAIAANSFYEPSRHSIISGEDVEEVLKNASSSENEVVVEGSMYIGGQEHFYLETNSSLVIPLEGNEGLQVFSSTQALDKTQAFCASATGLPMHKVVAKTKRMGGGFGGKETRTVFACAAAAIAAKITQRPVKITLDRNVDMSITGGRHTFMAKYRASVSLPSSSNSENEKPKLGAFDVQLYNNGGASYDLSGPVMDRALFHVDGTYKWKAFRARGVVCKTNQPPHTAFRGFGGPQGIAICEHVMDHLAQVTKVPAEDLRRNSMYCDGDYTPFGLQIIPKTWNVPNAWDQLVKKTRYVERKAAVKEFNSKNRFKKRGIAVLPTKFGIAFTTKFMNQGGALVHAYTDGTVLVSHGGTEMGQGLHTKVCQIAAQAFGIPVTQVHIDESATDKVANPQPTAASMSTDLYGMATLDACRQILARLKPIREKLGPGASFKEVVKSAYFQSIDLSAHGFFNLPGDRCGYNFDAVKPKDYDGPDNAFRGNAFNYFTQGVAISEVEIDVLSGDFKTIRSDVLVDVGSSINPSIDIGQIEGAFIQGMGWATTEEMVWGNEQSHAWVKPFGRLFTQGPGTYKIPGFNDTPEQFNVELMQGVSNPFAVHSSKAVGEPPFFLGVSVFFAIKDAIRDSRDEFWKQESLPVPPNVFCLNLPATSERIRMLCADRIAAEALFSKEDEKESYSGDTKILVFQPKGCF